MTGNHLSRLAAPKSWKVKRKGIKWITKPNAGPHCIKNSLPLKVIIRDILEYAKTSKEVKKILNAGEVLIDGTKRKDEKFAVGFMDVISIPKLKENYRLIYNKVGDLITQKITKDSNVKICKIKNKNKVKGKTQINLHDGKNILVEKDNYKTSNSIIIELPSKKIKEQIELKKGASIFLIGGKHIGEIAEVEDISKNKIMFKLESNEIFETLKKNVFVIGAKKSAIEIN